MKNFDTRTYSVNDFFQWHERNELVLQPKFQRRDVWSDKARSYFIDTVVRGKPTHKIFIRETIDPTTRETTREVVDGQQRLKTILSFLEDGFTVSRAHNEEISGVVFSELPDEIKKDILQYELAVDLLPDATDKDVLDIFARLNTYSRTLNQQELLHAQYFGEFKQTVYQLSLEYLLFWTENKILSDLQVLRMGEAELVSDLLIAMSDGIKAKKAIPSYYSQYDDKFPNREKRVKEFKATMDSLGDIMDGTLPDSNFKRKHLFYSLFTAVYHFLYGLPNFNVTRKSIKVADYPQIRGQLAQVDAIFKKNPDQRNRKERNFMDAARRATTDASVREYRTKFVCELINSALKS